MYIVNRTVSKFWNAGTLLYNDIQELKRKVRFSLQCWQFGRRKLIFFNLKIRETVYRSHLDRKGVKLVHFWHTDSLLLVYRFATTQYEIKRELDSSNQFNYKVEALNYCFVVWATNYCWMDIFMHLFNFCIYILSHSHQENAVTQREKFNVHRSHFLKIILTLKCSEDLNIILTWEQTHGQTEYSNSKYQWVIKMHCSTQESIRCWTLSLVL